MAQRDKLVDVNEQLRVQIRRLVIENKRLTDELGNLEFVDDDDFVPRAAEKPRTEADRVADRIGQLEID